MAKLLRLLKIVLINILVFLILLFLVNWGAGLFLKKTAQATRYELPNYEGDRDYARKVFKDYNSVQHEYYPFVGWKTKPYTGETTHIGENGQRVHTPPPSYSPSRKARFFGGSTMWGEGSDDSHTIPALFNKQFPDFEVHNHGQLAYNSRQELDALISVYAKGDTTDLVIFYDGVNDAAFLCPKEIDELPSHRLVPMFRDKIYVKKRKLIMEALYNTFLENIFRLIRQNSNQKKESPYDCLSDPDKAEEIAEMMMKNWELAHRIVTDRGGKFIAILQPAAFVGDPKTDHLQQDMDFKANFAEVYKHMRRKIGERNHPWIYDLSNAFDGNEYIFIDFCHVSPNGNEIMAGRIADIVRKELSLPSEL